MRWEKAMRIDVLEEFAAAAQMGRHLVHHETGVRVHRNPIDHVAFWRKEVHALVASIKGKPRKKRSWMDRPVQLASKWKRP
jgi:hypothetical protein